MPLLRLPVREKLKFAVLGSGKAMCFFVRLLLEKKFPKPIIVTHPYKEHERDRQLYTAAPMALKCYEDIFAISRNYNLEIIEAKDINKKEIIGRFKNRKVNAAFSFGCRSIIKTNFLSFLNGLVFNCHASDLPIERGGGGLTWRILNDENHVSITIHLVTKGIDSGDIILKKKRLLKKTRPYPIDILNENIVLTKEMLRIFINRAIHKTAFKLTRQNLEKGTYFPRLYTEKNAAINWFWSAQEVERFIRAFGYPYPGAWTFLNGQKIAITKARLPQHPAKFHPYLCGLIFRVYGDGSIEVATKEGSLIVNTISRDAVEELASFKCKIGERFYTPLEILEDSMLFRAAW